MKQITANKDMQISYVVIFQISLKERFLKSNYVMCMYRKY